MTNTSRTYKFFFISRSCILYTRRTYQYIHLNQKLSPSRRSAVNVFMLRILPLSLLSPHLALDIGHEDLDLHVKTPPPPPHSIPSPLCRGLGVGTQL